MRQLICGLLWLGSLTLGRAQVTGVAQQGATAVAPCFQLTGSKGCPDLTGSWLVPSDRFTDVASFDAYIASSIESSPTYVAAFQSAYGCTNFTGSLRFHTSVLCDYLVSFAAAECPEAAAITIKPLCQSTCAAFLQSLKDTYADPLQCTAIASTTADPNQKSQLNMRTFDVSQSPFSMYCNVLPNSACSSGLASDLAQCGFVNPNTTKSYCMSPTTMDPCCSSANQLFQVTLSQAVADPNDTYVFVASAVSAFLVMTLGCMVCAKAELRLRAQNKTAILFSDNTKVHASKSVVFSPRQVGKPGFDSGGLERKFTVARASVFPPSKQQGQYQLPEIIPTIPMPPLYRDQVPAKGLQEEWRCVEPFIPRLRDEIEILRDDVVVLEERFDDGWGCGTNQRTGQNGVFPMALFEPKTASCAGSGGRPNFHLGDRNSSILNSPW
ncbi:hypothetical protein SmJEL517_g05923 [Synchytrium microbalum]|uniref:SH3 domain-containing protein n=1 Tax=Synchytrium microbalum TaxID=1806994 RepID=A0A507BXN0_9FUNG|nr:uncharacterized protein SmJEL517_g05923 [Synchytrium microbalum]TPX30544.1 hypothetical protein SmJEL517_g05923 [Synchytrium microbalum]